MGWIYRDKYKDKKTGAVREAQNYMMAFYRRGKLVRVSTETANEREAKRKLRDTESDSDKGIPVTGVKGKITLAEGANLIIHDYKMRKLATLRELLYRLATLQDYFGSDMRLEDIELSRPPGAPSINTYIDKRQDEDGIENGTINRELSVLRRLFTLAIIAKRIAFKPHIPKLDENPPREGFFEPEQFAAVCKHLGQPVLADVATVAMITGWRTDSEILTIQWPQVDFVNDMLWVSKTKGNKKGKRRDFPLTGELRDVFERRLGVADDLKAQGVITPFVFFRIRRRQRSNLIAASQRAKRGMIYRCPACSEPVTQADHRGRLPRYCSIDCKRAARRSGLAAALAQAPRQVCADPIKRFTTAWQTATRLAGCPGRIPHDFRRTAVRNSRREGIDEGVCMQMHGHLTRHVADRYNITSEADLAEAREKLEGIIERKAAASSSARAKLAAAMRGRK